MHQFLQEFVFPHIGGFLGASATALAGFIFGRRKQNAETQTIEISNDSAEINNADKLLEMYKKTLDDLGTRYEQKFKEITEIYERKIKLLEDEISLHKRITTQLREENTMLRHRIKNLESESN